MSQIPWVNNPTTYGSVNISTGAKFAENCTIYHGAVVCDEVIVEEHVVIGSGVFVGRGTFIGRGTRIQHGAFIPCQTMIGREVFIGPNSTLCDDKYPRVNQTYKAEPPIVSDHASIGAGAVILPGVKIGHHAVVGAGAVVSRDIPPYALVTGVPARIQRHDVGKESHGYSDEDPSHD